MTRFSRTAIAGLVAMLFCTEAAAIKEWESEDGERYFSLVGAERLTGAFFHVPDLPVLYPDGDDALAASVTRLIFDGVFGEHVKLEINAFLDFSRQPFLSGSGAFATAGSFESPYRTPYLVGEFWQSGSLEGRGGLDRLSLILTFNRFSLTVGRAPLNYSVTQIFAPNDFFVPFASTAVNTVYKAGVDMMTAAYSPSALSLLQLSAVLGADENGVPTWGESALLLHARTVLEETELALFAGKVAERWVTGASMQAPVGRFNLRTEGHIGFPDTNGDFSLDDRNGDGTTKDDIHFRMAAGLDTFFTWHNSSLGLEYMYLSDGAARPSDYLDRAGTFYPDDPIFFGRHYLGFFAGTEIIPVLSVTATALLNVEDPSGIVTAMLVYNISNESDFVGGIMIPFGERPAPAEATATSYEPLSEYGAGALNLFLETRFYF